METSRGKASPDEILGKLAVESGLVHLYEVKRCELIQREDQTDGAACYSLGEILEEEGYVDARARAHLEKAVAAIAGLGETVPPPPLEASPRGRTVRFETPADHVSPGGAEPPQRKLIPRGRTFVPSYQKPEPDAEPPTSSGERGAPEDLNRAVRSVKTGSDAPVTSGVHAALADSLRAELGIKRSGAPKATDEKSITREIKKVIETLVKGRAYQQVLELLVDHRVTVIDPLVVASRTGLRGREVRKILDEWKLMGLVKPVATHPYAFSPSKGHLKQIDLFLERWRQPNWHTKIIAMLLAKEEGK